MNKKTNEELQDLVMKATSGDKEALEMLVTGVQDIIFNLSLRMLGTFADAEDATQDILLKMITHLSSFRGDSSFTTWVFSIAVNHLKNYKKHMFAHYPLSFEYYGEDIQNGKIQDVPDLTQNVEKDILAEELKMSCTNQSFLGGGLFADMFKDATAMIRDHISGKGEEWERIMHEPAFEKYFTVKGTALKNVPAGYEKEHPQAEYLKFKSWYLEYPIKDEELGDAETLLVKAAEIFRVMKPFNDYLNKALTGFQMPTR